MKIKQNMFQIYEMSGQVVITVYEVVEVVVVSPTVDQANTKISGWRFGLEFGLFVTTLVCVFVWAV